MRYLKPIETKNQKKNLKYLTCLIESEQKLNKEMLILLEFVILNFEVYY